MSMVLEYPTKMILYIVVIIVLVGIMWTFRENVSKICFLPPCNEQTCETKTPPPQNVNSLDVSTIEKYCSLCWGKNENCKENVLCYVINSENENNPSSVSISNDIKNFCDVKCNKATKTIFYQYNYISKKVELTC